MIKTCDLIRNHAMILSDACCNRQICTDKSQDRRSSVTDKIVKTCFRIENNTWIKAIRRGLVMIIPVIMISSFSLLLINLPVPAYQKLIGGSEHTIWLSVLNTLENATFGMLSVYACISIGYNVCGEENRRSGRAAVMPLISLCTFFIAVGFATPGFDDASLGASGMFLAILCGVLSSAVYIRLSKIMGHRRWLSDGADEHLNHAVEAIAPAAAVVILFSMVQWIICLLTGADNYWDLMNMIFCNLYKGAEESFRTSLLFVFLENLLWFFGIQGSDALGIMNVNIFDPASKVNIAAAAAGQLPTRIFTKQFFDCFTLIGGVGNSMSLLIAVLLFSKRKSSRTLAKAASVPILFNISEIMVFGFPVVFNPIMLIPFLLTPIVAFLISTAAMMLKLVPLTTHFVTWTVPVFWSGYLATGSVRGSILQLIILLAGVMIYRPFVHIHDEYKEHADREELNAVVKIYADAEQHGRAIRLVETEGSIGSMARRLVRDLRQEIDGQKLNMYYQPQFDCNRHMFGAEALIRWKHSDLGFIYPPLIFELAEEGGFLETLEKYVFRQVKADMEHTGNLQISVNITALTVKESSFTDFLIDEFGALLKNGRKVYIEITEQSEFNADETMRDNLERLKKAGFCLSIDDFSMGHTSLQYLQNGDFDQVKLDGCLSRQLLHDVKTEKIIDSIVYLSKTAGFTVLAEYVETDEQMNKLSEIGCREYQGYLFSPAIPLGDLETLLKNNQK